MPLQNSADSFGAVTKALHWATALLVVAAYALALSLDQFERGTDDWRRILHLHQWVGFTIGFLIITRIYWRVQSKHQPRQLSGGRFEHWAASTAHFLLYFFLITMPITGWAGGKMNRTYFNLFEIPSFYNTPLYEPLITQGLGLTWEEFEKPLDFYHYGLVGPYLLWMLVALHVSAALFHHFIRRDATLVRMLPSAKQEDANGQPQ